MEEKAALNAHLWASEPDVGCVEPEWCSTGCLRGRFPRTIVSFAGLGRIRYTPGVSHPQRNS